MTTESTAINYKIGNERLISVTEKAARKLESLLEEKGKPEGALRLAVIGGGCSGLQYVMDLVEGPKERDILVPTSNVRLVVDPKNALFVSGSVLDYSEDLKKAASKLPIRMPSRTALAAKVLRFRRVSKHAQRAWGGLCRARVSRLGEPVSRSRTFLPFDTISKRPESKKFDATPKPTRRRRAVPNLAGTTPS